MQSKPKKHQPHPAEAISKIVFEVCCWTLSALRMPTPFDVQHSDPLPDLQYQEDWRKLKRCPEYDSINDQPEHPRNFVEWDLVLENMNRPLACDRDRHELVARQRLQLLHTAKFHPQCVLAVAIRQVRELIPEENPRPQISPVEAAKPFGLAKVLEWLSQMDLIHERDGRYWADGRIFHADPRLPRTHLGLDTLRTVADWSMGPDGPPARLLHFHLRGLDGTPVCSREILAIQGMSAGIETLEALLHVLPQWSRGRKRMLRDMIVARWIRSMELYCHNPGFRSKSAALCVMRWAHLCRLLKDIPSTQHHPRGSSAGFQ